MTENMLDRSSPRRGSLTHIHRQPSGSFPHNSRLASSSSASATATTQVNSAQLHTICKDLDKFTRYFIIKSVQVIVQSRIEGNKKVKTECKPNGNDWFNINIPDILEISDKTKAILDSENLTVKSNWRVCCEISLRSNDGSRIVLEHWIISNRSNFSSNQRLNNSQASPRGNRSSTSHLASGNTVQASNVVSSASASSRVRPSNGTFGGFVSVSRTRLNSIDDDSCDIGPASSNNKLLLGVNNENVDLKSSTSCFSLSSAPASQQPNDQASLIAPSPSTNSLNSNHITNTNQDRSANNSPSSSQQPNSSNNTKTSATSSIYTIYNKMSLLLKTLMTTAYIVPAHRIASKNPQTNSCIMCYRVYACPMPPQQFGAARDSIENINNPLSGHENSPNKRSLSSNSSLSSVNIREFVGPEELDSFCPILKLGSIKTEISELDLSFCYRTDVKNPSHLLKTWRSKETYNQIIDEDCIIAAKQLLAGNDFLNDDNSFRAEHKTLNGINSNNLDRKLDYINRPLKPAFASNENRGNDKNIDSNQEVIESAFVSLLQDRPNLKDENLVDIASSAINHAQVETINSSSTNNGRPNVAKSEPIQVPKAPSNQPKHQDLYQNLSAGSTPKSLTDSFVFVDLNPPFASEEQNDINSFFHGPSPTFNNNSFDGLKDVDDLMNQLNVIEANASQIDDFVDNICASENEEEEQI